MIKVKLSNSEYIISNLDNMDSELLDILLTNMHAESNTSVTCSNDVFEQVKNVCDQYGITDIVIT